MSSKYKNKTYMDILKRSKVLFDIFNIKIKNTNDKEVVLIEPMDNSNMCEYVIKNAMYFLHDNWNLTILHGNKNKNHFESITKDLGKVKLINLNHDGFPNHPYGYNEFLTSEKFHNMIEKDVFLIIQLDVLILKKIPDFYLKYSYVGAPWPHWPEIPCGNGGFSLRNKSDMLKIIRLCKWNGEPEDLWFSKMCIKLRLNICPRNYASLFSSEWIFNIESCGVHDPMFSEDKLILMAKNIKWFKEINYICSLGSLCHTVSWMKQMKLKKCSYPFDWIFSDPEMIIDCLNDDFEKFLDRSLHIASSDKDKSGHKIYGKYIFKHHCILEEEHYQYFVRCVNRFRELIKRNENKLFIISFINRKQDIGQELQKKLNDLHKNLEKITNNFDLLVVWHTIGTELKSNMTRDKKFKNLIYINITTQTESDGVQIMNFQENFFYNKCIYSLYDFKIIDDIK